MVVVIGATGFIGLYTVEKLIKEGFKVVATGRNDIAGEILKNEGAEFVNVDIKDESTFLNLPTDNVEAVILLAGLLPANAPVDIEKDENALDYVETNIAGTVRVLEYCRKNGIKKIITTSSYADVRNAWKKGYAIKETEPRDFLYTGDHSGYVISNDILEYYNQQHGMNGCIFRLPPVYGVGPHSEIYVNGKYYKTGIQTFIENAKNGNDIEIWGDPNITRDIIYVKDVAQAFIDVIRSDKAKGLYNMTSSTQLSLDEQVKTIIKVFSKGKRSNIIYRPEKKNNTPSSLFNIDKAKKDFGFDPKFKSYYDMMLDYKKELESGRWDSLINSRKKDKT